jgi:WD40 repeat protein
MKKMLAHLQAPLPSVAAARADVPAGLAAVIQRMLAKAPAERFATPAELAEAVAPFCVGSDLRQLADQGSAASGVAPAQGGTGPFLSSAMTGTQPRQPKVEPLGQLAASGHRPGRRWIVLGLGGAAAAILVALAIFLRIRHPDGAEKVIPLPEGTQITVESARPPAGPGAEKKPAPSGAASLPSQEALHPQDIPSYEREIAAGENGGKLPPGLVAILGDSRLKHWNDITALAYCAADQRLVSLGRDGTLRLWELKTGRQLRRWSAGAMAVSQDGTTIAVAPSTSGVVLWDAVANREIRTLQTGWAPMTSVALRRDGKLLACSAKGFTKLYDLTADEPKVTPVQGDLKAMSPDGELLALDAGPKTLRLWSVATAREQRALEVPAEPSAVFSPDGKHLAVWSGRAVGLWDTTSGKEVHRLQADVTCLSATFSPDSTTLLASRYTSSVRTWDVLTGQKIDDWDVKNWPRAAAFTADGAALAIASGSGVHFWSVGTKKETALAGVSGQALVAGTFSPRGGRMALGGENGNLYFWNGAGSGPPRLAGNWGAGQLQRLLYSSDATMLALNGFAQARVLVWDVPAAKVLQTLPQEDYTWYCDMAFSPDGRVLATFSGRETTIRLWDPRTGTPCGTIEVTRDIFGGLAFSPDGRWLAQGMGYGKVAFWEMPSRRPGFTLPANGGVLEIAFSPDGKLLAVEHFHNGCLCDVANRKLLDVPCLDDRGPITTAFRPDSRCLAWAITEGDGRGEIRFLDCRGLKEKLPPLRIGPDGGRITKLAYSPDGRYLLSVNANGTVYVFRNVK